jgi:hypothetical protein
MYIVYLAVGKSSSITDYPTPLLQQKSMLYFQFQFDLFALDILIESKRFSIE